MTHPACGGPALAGSPQGPSSFFAAAPALGGVHFEVRARVKKELHTYTYRALRQFGNFGQSSAVNLVQSALGLITILIFNKIVRRVDPDASLF